MSFKVEVELSLAFQYRLFIAHLALSIEEVFSTVKGLLGRLVGEYGEKTRPLLFEREQGILAGVMVMVNNRIFMGSALQSQEVPEDFGGFSRSLCP
jgi:hypothetical protein